MALTKATIYGTKDEQPFGRNSYPVRSAMKIYYGALVGLSTVGSSDGRLVNWSSGSGALRFVGMAIPTQGEAIGNNIGVAGEITGNAAGSRLCPVIEGGITLENVAITGLTSASLVGRPVYASDESTFTLTATSNVGAVGVVDRYISSGRGDLRLYSKMEYYAMENIGKV